MALRAGEDAFLLAFFLVTALWEPAMPFYPGNWALTLGDSTVSAISHSPVYKGIVYPSLTDTSRREKSEAS